MTLMTLIPMTIMTLIPIIINPPAFPMIKSYALSGANTPGGAKVHQRIHIARKRHVACTTKYHHPLNGSIFSVILPEISLTILMIWIITPILPKILLTM